MWTSTLELDAAHVIPTRLLGRFWRGAYFSSFAPLQVRNLPRNTLPEAHWVRIRNILAGICGSDLHLVFGDGDFRIVQAVLQGHELSYPGHEVLGEVIEVGNEVSLVHVGDRVVFQHGPNCATAGVQPLCRSCATGNYTLCEHGSLPGPYPIGGGWSEEMLLHEQQLFRISPALNDEQAVLLEPTAVAVHAVLRHLPRAGERVLVVGAGTIGLLIVQVVRALAPQTEISVVARHAFQVEQATRMGAAHIIYPQDSYQSVQRITGAELQQGGLGNRMLLGGFDVIYDTVGNQRTTHDSLRWTHAGGTIVMVGEHLHPMRVDLTPLCHQEINLIGTTGHGNETWPLGSSTQQSTFNIAAELIEQGALRPEQLITHRFALTNYRDALQAARRKSESRALKIVFDYALLPPSVVPNVRAARPRRQVATTTHTSQPIGESTDYYPAEDDFEQIEELEEPAGPLARQSRIPEPIVMPVMTSIPPTPLSPVLSQMVPPPILDDDDESKTIVISRPHQQYAPQQPQQSQQSEQQEQPTPGVLEEDTQAAMPIAPAPMPAPVPAPVPEPAPTSEQSDEATKTFVVPKAKRVRPKRTSGTIITAPAENGTATDVSEPDQSGSYSVTGGPAENAAETSPVLPATPVGALQAQDKYTPTPPLSLSPTWMDTLQEQQESPDDTPQWLSSLHVISQKTEETGLQQPLIEEEKSIVTKEASGALQPVEDPCVPVEHPSPSIQSKDENGISQGK